MDTAKGVINSIKIILSTSPNRVFFDTFPRLLVAGKRIFIDVIFLAYLLKMCEEKPPFSQVIWFIGIALFVILIAEIVGAWYKHLYCPKADFKTKQLIDHKIVKKAMSVDLICYEDPRYYDRFQRVQNDYFNVNMGVYRTARDLLVSIIENVAVVILMATIDPLSLVFGIIPFLLVFFLGKRSKKLKVHLNKANTEPARRASYSERTIYMKEYAKEMRLFRIYEPIIQNYKEAVEELKCNIRETGRRIAVVDFFRRVLSENIMYFGLLIYILLRVFTVGGGETKASDWLMLINSIASFTYTMQSIADKTQLLTTQIAQVDMCDEYFAYQPAIPEYKKGREISYSDKGHIIRFENVTFTYPGQTKTAVRNLDLIIEPKQKIGIVGVNGAGKSTMLKLLLRLYDPECGRITCDGIDIRDYTVSEYRALFGIALQDVKMFSLSIAENVLAGSYIEGDNKKVREALRKSGFESKLSSIPGGMQAILTKEFDDAGVVLSGGEAQKIAIARVHASNSQIVLLDEPSSALDPIAEHEMVETMYKACIDKSMVLISHRLSNMTSLDCIYVIDDGQIVEQGSHNELMEQNGIYARMFSMQAEGYRDERG